jgi:ABC-type transporter Mla maintaining outer membrane lipid asymmetry ATPase subunit MlaF
MMDGEVPIAEAVPGASVEASEAAISLRNVGQTFGGQGGVWIDRLDIRRGVVTAIIGRSGCGKSVLLKNLIGLMKPDAGPWPALMCRTLLRLSRRG